MLIQNNHKENNLNYLLFLLIATFWGGSFIAIKYAINAWPPIFSAALRVGLSLVVLSTYFIIQKKNLAVPFNIRYRIWIAGLFAQGIPFGFLFWGEQLISPGLAGILNGTVPIWTFVLSLIFFGRKTNVTPFKILGLLLGMVGVLIIFSPMISFHGAKIEIVGTIAVLGMAVSYATSMILNQYLFSEGIRVDFHANLYHQHWASFIYLLVASLLLEKWPAWHTLIFSYQAIIATIYLGVILTAIAWVFYYHLIREWGAVRTSTLAYFIPITALIGDYLFLHTIPMPTEIIGIGVIIPAVILIQFL